MAAPGRRRPTRRSRGAAALHKRPRWSTRARHHHPWLPDPAASAVRQAGRCNVVGMRREGRPPAPEGRPEPRRGRPCGDGPGRVVRSQTGSRADRRCRHSQRPRAGGPDRGRVRRRRKAPLCPRPRAGRPLPRLAGVRFVRPGSGRGRLRTHCPGQFPLLATLRAGGAALIHECPAGIWREDRRIVGPRLEYPRRIRRT